MDVFLYSSIGTPKLAVTYRNIDASTIYFLKRVFLGGYKCMSQNLHLYSITITIFQILSHTIELSHPKLNVVQGHNAKKSLF